MTEESPATSHLPVAMTTTEVDEMHGTENTTTSSVSRSSGFYFQYAVIAIGIVGTAANALILYALVASKQHKKHVLIVNQNVFDLFSSIFLVITYAMEICNIPLIGLLGYWVCMIILSDFLIWCGIIGSVINLAIITIERYLKVVHPFWSKKKLHRWVIYSAMAFAWIAAITKNAGVVFPTSALIDGVCYVAVNWESKTAKLIHLFWHVVSFYVIILLIFIFCYWRILIVIRRQAKVMAAHGSSTTQAKKHKIQSNVIKTMILVSAFYAISWLPNSIIMMLINLNSTLPFLLYGYFVSLFVGFLYTCTNPFIYATKFDPVKQVLLRMNPFKKTSEPSTGTTINVATATTRAAHAPN